MQSIVVDLMEQRCIDESDVNVEELGELILQYSECVNTMVSLLNEPMDVSDDSV